MNARLPSLSLGLWSLGLFEMGAARGVFGHGPGSAWFDLGASFSLVGALSYCLCAALVLLGRGGRS